MALPGLYAGSDPSQLSSLKSINFSANTAFTTSGSDTSPHVLMSGNQMELKIKHLLSLVKCSVNKTVMLSEITLDVKVGSSTLLSTDDVYLYLDSQRWRQEDGGLKASLGYLSIPYPEKEGNGSVLIALPLGEMYWEANQCWG